MDKQAIGVGIMGFGVIAGQVAKVLLERKALLEEQVGCPVVLRRIKLLPEDLKRPLANEFDAGLFTTDEEAFFATPDMQIIVEAIGGENPAQAYLRRAISAGKSVVTSNKEVIAKHGASLLDMAQDKQVGLRYEASVGGGIPLVTPFQHDLVANHISRIYAIINGTTNYILTRMEKEGLDFAIALKQAQKLGYAEANPENDIEGIDSTYKLAIMASLVTHKEIRPEQIYREGISRLTSRDFQYARELGFAIKLLAIAKNDDNTTEVRVHPVFISEESLLANVDGVYNAILVEGDLVGKVLFYGKGAGPLPTSSAVVSDVIACAQDIVSRSGCHLRWRFQHDTLIRPMSEIDTRYYLRMSVADQAGVLSHVTRVLGEHDISISSIIQKETDETTQTAEIVVMTHRAKEAHMQRALKEMAALPVVKEVSNFVRVED